MTRFKRFVMMYRCLALLLVLSCSVFTTAFGASRTFFPHVEPGLFTAATYGNGTFVVAGEGGRILTSTDSFTWTERGEFDYDWVGVAYGGGRFVAVSPEGFLAISTNAQDWVEAPGIDTSDYGNITGIAFGTINGGVFVVCLDSGHLLSSPDGISWTLRYTTSSAEEFYGIAFGANIFAVAGLDYNANDDPMGLVRTSANLTLWRRERYQSGEELYGVNWVKDKFIAVGLRYDSLDNQFSRLVASNDKGTAWPSRSVPGEETLLAAAYGNGAFWAVGESGALLRSPDGLTDWVNARYVADDDIDFRAAASDPVTGRAILIGERLLASPSQGALWVDVIDIDSVDLNKIAFGNGTYVATSSLGIVWTSKDLALWRPVRAVPTELADVEFHGITFGAGRFVAVGSYSSADLGDVGLVITSLDGVFWTLVRAQSNEYPMEVSYGDGNWVVVGSYRPSDVDQSLVLDSINGTSWSRRSMPAAFDANLLSGVAHGAGIGFVAVGDTGPAVFSNNGIDWVDAGLPSDDIFNGIAFSQGRFVAVSDAGSVWVSATGKAWTEAPGTTTNSLSCAVSVGALTVAAGRSGTLIASSAGAGWELIAPVTAESLSGAVSVQGKAVIVGTEGTVLTSADGRQWTKLFGPDIPKPTRGSIVRNGGEIQLIFTGQDGALVRVESTATPALPGSWTLLQETTLIGGQALVKEPVQAQGNRFYRAITR